MNDELDEDGDLDGVELDLLEPELIEEVVVIEAAPVEPVRSGPPAIVQAAAVAATSFVAGAAAATMLSRRRARPALMTPRSERSLPQSAAVTAQTFIVHVQSIRRG